MSSKHDKQDKQGKPDDHLEQLDRRIKAILAQMQRSSVPSKRHTKLPGKTSPNSFNQNLKGVPGSGRFGWTWSALQKMADHPETGCKLATPAQEKNLAQSGDNSYTTKGNYIL
jgi:hypothetical protein